MALVTEPLSACGATFIAREGGRLPLTVIGARDPLPLDYRLPVPSAQVKSAVLLARLNAPCDTRVVESEAKRDHSESMTRQLGAADGRREDVGAGTRAHERVDRVTTERGGE